MSNRMTMFFLLFTPFLFSPRAEAQQAEELTEWNHRIRREKFDLVLPEVMRANDVDMWIHVMRETIPDPRPMQDCLLLVVDSSPRHP